MIDGLSKKLDTSFENDFSEPAQERSVMTSLTDLEKQTEKYNKNKIEIQDVDIIKKELVQLLNSASMVKNIVEKELARPGFSASMIESYSILVSQCKDLLVEYRKMCVNVADLELNVLRAENSYQIRTGNITQNIQNNNTFNLSSNELDNLISKSISNAKENNQLDAIEVDFEVDSQIK